MAKDIFLRHNDLSWLTSPTGPTMPESILENPSAAKPYERVNSLEPWEPITEAKVCRNLNSTWGINAANDFSFNSSSNAFEKVKNEKRCSSIGEFDMLNSASSNKKIYENFENDRKSSNSCINNYTQYDYNNAMKINSSRTVMQETLPNFSEYELNANACSHDENLSMTGNASCQNQNMLAHLINYLNEENAISREQSDIANSMLSPVYSKNQLPVFPFSQANSSQVLNPNFCHQSIHLRKKNDSALLNFIGDQYSPPSPCSGKSSPRTNTDLVALMQELAVLSGEVESTKLQKANLSTPFQSPPSTPGATPTKGCVFCKNNSYHSTFYKSHLLKDDRGHCQCPVLRTYVCPLCGGTGDSAHTLKYCPRNTVTRGDPIAAGLPPGKVTNWREVATKMATHHKL